MATLARALRAAADLASEEGENPEYDRALAELLADTFGEELRDLFPRIFDDGMNTARPTILSTLRTLQGLR